MSKRDFDIISLDIETSSSDVETGTILSIGCVRLSDLEPFYADVRHNRVTVTPEALRANSIDVCTLDNKSRESLSTADQRLLNWLKSSGFYRDGKKYCIIAMGMNVGTFDMPFVRKYLPQSASLFGNRSLDLNALLFADALIRDVEFYDVKRAAKSIGTSFAHDRVPDLKPHHALYDAFSNIGVFNYLLDARAKSVGEVVWEGGA